jgi:hypothetical protein
MVSGVQNTTSSVAYLKSAQLGSGSNANFKKETENKPQETSAVPSPVEQLKETSAKDTSPSTSEKTSNNTQLQARNDEETLQTEQTRGSLLDIAV